MASSSKLPAEATARACRKKRAPRACEACRSRKVRCDVTKTQTACTNCRLDNKTCVIPVSKRRHVGDRVLCSASFEDRNWDPHSPICDAIIDFGDISTLLPETNTPFQGGLESGYATLDAFNIAGATSSRTRELNHTTYAATTNISVSSQQSEFMTSYPSPARSVASDRPPQSSLPRYITPLAKGLAAAEWEYLQSKGALVIPDTPYRDLLIQSYAKWVHPFTPMLDLPAILRAIFSDGEDGTVGLLLVQSILFAATAFLPAEGKARSTRKLFYDRARLLHDFHVESDLLAITQSAILLSFWDGDSDPVRDSRYWIGVATLHATSIGLNFDPDMGDVEPSQGRLFKLTWWSLLTRDRLLAIATRRPVQNKAFSFAVPMLQIEDFELEALNAALKATDLSDAFGLSELETLATCCIALGQLAEYIDNILAVQYSVHRVSGQRNAVISLVPKATGLQPAEILGSGGELQLWYRYLPTEIQQSECPGDNIVRNDELDVVKVHKALLSAYFSMTLMSLYRPLLMVTHARSHGSQIRDISRRMVLRSATRTTEIFGGLYAKKLIDFLPDTAIAALEPAAVTHLLSSMSDDFKVRETSSQKFYLCWQILLRLEKSYALAEMTTSMLNVAAQRLKASRNHSYFASPAEPTENTEKIDVDRSDLVKFNDGVPSIEDTSDIEVGVSFTNLGSPVLDGLLQFGEESADLPLIEDRLGFSDCDFERLICWESVEGCS